MISKQSVLKAKSWNNLKLFLACFKELKEEHSYLSLNISEYRCVAPVFFSP